MERIYETLKTLRKKNGFTQQEIADYLNLDFSSISKIENGKTDISLSKLELLSKKYGMTVVEMLAYPNQVTVSDQNNKIEEIKVKLKNVLDDLDKL